MKLSPPAKINLSLRILGRRDDGFHEIETLMTRVTLEDSILLERTEAKEGIVLECSDPTIPADGKNLVVVAAEAYRKAAKLESLDIRIILEKHIPNGAGLGGGSSDAASILVGLNALYEERVEPAALPAVAAQIGSDVTFFLGPGSGAAWCRGRGEIYEAANLQGPNRSVILIKPPFPVPTPWAYKSWKNARRVPGLPYDPQHSPWGELYNDLEVPVFEKFPLLGLIKRWLLQHPEVEFALMSGSGSTVFGILREDAGSDANNLAAAITSAFGSPLWIHVCKICL